MTEVVSIKLEERMEKGKQEVRRLRSQGFIPATFYGTDYRDSLTVKVLKSEIYSSVNSAHRETVRLEASLPSGQKELCLMREIQRNPVNDEILHIDLLQLVKGHKIKVNVPIEAFNKDICKGIKLGGVFEQVIHEIELDVLPSEIPESIKVDVSGLELGSFIHLSDLALPESAEIAVDGEEVVFTVAHARAAAEETVEEEPTEVEVVGKGKSKEETE